MRGAASRAADSSRGSSTSSSTVTALAWGVSVSAPAPCGSRRLRLYAPSVTDSTPATARRARNCTMSWAARAGWWGSSTGVAPSFGAVEAVLPSCRAMRALVGVCVAAALLMAGCGGKDEPPAPAKTTAPKATATAPSGAAKLLDALAEVKSGEAAHKAFYWSNIAGLRDVAGYPDHIADLKFDSNRRSRWLLGLGVGAQALGQGDAAVLAKVGERLGFDYLAATSALSIGEPARPGGRLDGGDGGGVAGGGRKLGAKGGGDGGRPGP